MTAQKFISSAKAKGFTLIELLVVIGILGILATALIATIDPFEQLRKANDSNVKNVLVEYLNANLRYYTTHSGMPWNQTTNGGFAGCGAPSTNAATMVAGTLNAAGGSNCVNGLISDGELKTSFTNASAILGKIIVFGSSNASTACFLPESKSGQNDPQAKFSSVGAPQVSGCKSQGGTNNCYYCSEQ